MIYPAIILLGASAVVGALIDAKRRPGTPRDWRKQNPTLVLLVLALVFFIMAGTGL